MKDHRIYNFNPGPAAIPLPVLEKVRAEFLNYKGSGMSITEISHRSPQFMALMDDTILRIKRLLNLGDEFTVLFLQGGASLQFAMVPMNFLGPGDTADYIDTGTWSTKAIKEAGILGKTVSVPASSKDRDYAYIPKDVPVSPEAVYVHITSNNTIKGTQYHQFPQTNGVPLVADMSSDILSRPMDVSKFGLIYAGAQKNLGPSGVCMAIIRQDMLDRIPGNLPSMLSYTTYAKKNSLYNTPPCFAIYMVQQVAVWLEETVGGLAEMDKINREKAKIIYDVIDASAFYTAAADKDSRSLMNITFRLADPDKEGLFVQEAAKHDLAGLKGHRSVGGCRASLYNAAGLDQVKALAEFMKDFEKTNG